MNTNGWSFREIVFGEAWSEGLPQGNYSRLCNDRFWLFDPTKWTKWSVADLCILKRSWEAYLNLTEIARLDRNLTQLFYSFVKKKLMRVNSNLNRFWHFQKKWSERIFKTKELVAQIHHTEANRVTLKEYNEFEENRTQLMEN